VSVASFIDCVWEAERTEKSRVCDGLYVGVCVFKQGWCVSAALSASAGAFLCEGLSSRPVSQGGMGTSLSHIR